MAIDTPSPPPVGAVGAVGATQPSQSAPARDRLVSLFPDPNATAAPWWRRRRRAIAAVVVVALVASGVLAARAFGASDPTYRTATVGRRDVDALLNGVATIEPVAQAAVAFPASGTVASVNVKVGDAVSIGQTLASLDPEALTQSLHEKQAALAQAELALEQALNGEAGSGGGESDGNGVRLTAATIPGPAANRLGAAQQAVLDAQKRVDAALHASTVALDSAATVCAAAGVGAPSPTPATAEQLTACQTATNAVLTAQKEVNVAQRQLADAAKALDTLIAQQASTPSTPSAQDAPANDAPANESPTNGSDQPNGATGSSPSAADLVAYQKAVDAAAAEVAVAEQAIAQATIVSPIAGTVQGVTLAVGDEVDAASSTASIVVVGAGGFEATTTVSVDDITDVKVGQKATLLPDGSKRALTGSVSSISLTPDAAASTTSYRVVIGLDEPDADLDNGSTGAVSIVTESARSGLAVPTSAVSAIGDRHLVTVLDGTTTKRVPVDVGVVGETWTEITSGVTAGQQVVIADLSEPLPGSATESSNGSDNGSSPQKFQFGPPGFSPRGAPVGK
jgi:HlyD family secretion protein